ncbi:aminopeptidase [Nonlabens sp. MB-3u-79]|uniref:M1 family metallopeptidase n=1 Tax=Nonlabens sp. MB-3u-79 TaxID=2058134 RepID=UPI000C304D84|nr:M1 family metallopeptidase [Nonlabens sp. MB-3u-79]AUC78309.1 aminopeptidase [Nonlabens sp. MB-3u-79]|tara:strand:- start:43911 stop:46208 length:2298 start_codon:yes stop_codon:yes gene_type:complete
MKAIKLLFISMMLVSFGSFAQEEVQKEEPKAEEHTNINKFRQLYQEFSTPNQYRSASGAPGPKYYQQRADYEMDIRLDDANHHIYGYETITYTNNSPDVLDYLWVQLDQNMRAKDSKTPLIEGGGVQPYMQPAGFAGAYLQEPFDGGFNIKKVLDKNGNSLKYMINQTMMRVEMPEKLKSGKDFEFDIEWDYNINNHVEGRGRSGYEQFPDGHRAYVIAQFYPRMAVYNDVEGWQNSQFFGRDEFALPFGTFEVNITVPEDHWLDGTGKLTNRKDVYSKAELARYEQAQKSFENPVVIRTQQEAEKLAMMPGSKAMKTWKLKADYVRDFGWTSSRRYVADAMAVKVGGKDIMAVSIYPPEGNPLWEQWSTKAVAQTLKSYSRMTFDYPYHKAISVHAKNQGMEYPMICWNYGRPDENGDYSDRVKFGMISVIIHEVGHNYFPMIVNSDERQWTWMDEGLNTFVQYVAEQDMGENYPAAIEGLDAYPSRRGPAANIVPYMAGDQRYIAPIMSKGINTYQFGSNAYGKPGTALNILRETVMGRDLFDYAFRTYSQRWMFKHPTPEDFFRTMEDASAVDLDWFWRGWFYTTQFNDMGIKSVDKYFVSGEKNQAMKDMMKARNIDDSRVPALVYMVKEGSADYNEDLKGKEPAEVVGELKTFMMDNFTATERAAMKSPKFFYEIKVEKPGGLVMPIIIEYTFADGTTETVTHPAEIWRLNDKEVGLSKASDKEITKIVIDPKLETADVDTSNNTWPTAAEVSKFDQMKK